MKTYFLYSYLPAGLGQMGHGMAKNIRLRIPDSSLLVVYDVNQEAVQRFIDEHNGAGVQAAKSPKEVAELAVSSPRSADQYRLQ